MPATRRPPIASPLRRALALVLPLVACGTETWRAELPSDPAAPIAVRSVTARRSIIAQIGVGPVSLGSDSAKNSVSFELDAVVQHPLPVGASLGTRSACTVDGVVWGTQVSTDAAFRGDPPGAPQTSFARSFFPNAYAAGPPTACEVELRMQPGRVGPDVPPFVPVELGRFCWTPEGITATACPEAALPRAVPAGTIAIDSIRAQWHPGDASSPGGLAFAARITVGHAAGAGDLTAAAACEGDGAPLQSRSTLLAGLRDYVPGERFAIAGTAFDADDFATPPSRCTVEIRHRDRSPLDGGRFLPAASACLQGGTVTEGACEGLAPGPATVRLEGRTATIERGAHREGPFALDDAGVGDRVVHSLKATRDEGIVVVAPPGFPQAEVTALVDAATAAHLAVALSPA
jgi:hypothetical protein